MDVTYFIIKGSFFFGFLIFMLEKLLEGFSRHQKIRVLYDVACTLSKHLNVYK